MRSDDLPIGSIGCWVTTEKVWLKRILNLSRGSQPVFFYDHPPECCAFLGKEPPPHSSGELLSFAWINFHKERRTASEKWVYHQSKHNLHLFKPYPGFDRRYVHCVSCVERPRAKNSFPTGRPTEAEVMLACSYDQSVYLTYYTNERSGMPSAIKF